jgi:hypothetical protein
VESEAYEGGQGGQGGWVIKQAKAVEVICEMKTVVMAKAAKTTSRQSRATRQRTKNKAESTARWTEAESDRNIVTVVLGYSGIGG